MTRTIADTEQRDRYLMVAERLSIGRWATSCDRVRSHTASLPASKRCSRFFVNSLRLIDEELPPTCIPFVVLFAYADIPAGTEWDAVFDPLNAEADESTRATLKFGIFWERAATTDLAHGHHQIAVIDFPNGVPSLLDSLPVDADRLDYDYIGLCRSEDLGAIRKCHAEQEQEQRS
ncbi:MAG: hypothetical protein AAF266_15585 [Planctomycetota bacterium]